MNNTEQWYALQLTTVPPTERRVFRTVLPAIQYESTEQIGREINQFSHLKCQGCNTITKQEMRIKI